MTAAWIWANNKIEKNKINSQTKFILNLNIKTISSYLGREIYHCPTTIISIVRTKGKAGYLVWKSAGGHGDHEISLPFLLIGFVTFFTFCGSDISVENPLLMNIY